MQRLVFFTAILLSFATLFGVTTAHAHRYVSTPIVVLNHVDAENVPIRIMVKVQRGEIDLGSGIVMPCGAHHAIAATVPVLPPVPEADTPQGQACLAEISWQDAKRLRPPISI